MARASKVDLCMICGHLPCECAGKPKAPKVPKVTGTIVSHDMKFTPDLVLPNRPYVLERRKPAAATFTIQVEEADMVMWAALRNAALIMHPEEVAKHHQILSTPPSREESIAFWKARRRDEQAPPGEPG
jgi:hypothetical protein